MSRTIPAAVQVYWESAWAVCLSLLLMAAPCFMCLMLQWRRVIYCTQKISCTVNACSALKSVSDNFCNVRTQVVDACPRCNNDTALHHLFTSKDAIYKSSCQRAELFPFYIKTRGILWMLSCCPLCVSPPKGSVVARVCRILAKRHLKLFGLYTHYLLMNCT